MLFQLFIFLIFLLFSRWSDRGKVVVLVVGVEGGEIKQRGVGVRV